MNKIVRRLSTALLLITVIVQLVTVIIMEFGPESHDIEEIHEVAGFTFFGLVLLHIVFFRKSLKHLISQKN
jgi:cytochrome b561